MRAAHRIKDQAAALYARGISIDAIAGKLDVDRHVARAAVYLAMKEGGAS